MSARRCTDAQRAALVRAREKRSELDDAVTCNLAVVSSCGLASREAVIAYLRTLDIAA